MKLTPQAAGNPDVLAMLSKNLSANLTFAYAKYQKQLDLVIALKLAKSPLLTAAVVQLKFRRNDIIWLMAEYEDVAVAVLFK